ncbi:MAG: BLUF domain-containing protein [Erythrobacter sp.]
MLSQYLYISTAPGLSAEEVDQILESSVANNSARGITGILLYNGRNFMQLLEGKEDDLAALMARIAQDSRHSGVSTLDRREVSKRSCVQWAMKRVFFTESVDDRRRGLDKELPADLDPEMRKTIVNFAMLN